jgi:endonuclease/exonuclease/phosphatase family metal-dependent hydrolase
MSPLIRAGLLMLFGTTRLHALSLLTYNVAGNGTTNWSTNTAQVQAIGRQMAFLQPDIIAFNEIPNTNTWQMANFVTAYLPGYFLATNSATDGFIRSVILSRYAIVGSKSWLHSSDLNPYGYTNANFTRDLFEAEIDVPGATQHLHVFTTHLKAFSDTNSAAKRAAEASAISNFFVSGFLTTNAARPYGTRRAAASIPSNAWSTGRLACA